jgi:hypothetical protein
MNARDAGSERFTDPYDFLMAKFNQQMFPAIDQVGVGGGWLEGENYGRAMKRHLFESFLLLKETAGLDYFNDPAHPFGRHAVRYELHTCQPGHGVLYPGGDASQEPTLTVNPYDRHMMLLLAEGLRGTIESQYARYWLQHDVTVMSSISEMIPVDYFLDQPELPERNYAELPTRHHASGIDWMNSRSGWSEDEISVSFTCTERVQGHQHSDQNHFVIYMGGASAPWDGWMLTDTQPYSSGLPRSAHYHNTILVDNTSQRFGDGTGDMVKFEAAPTYTYAVGDASDAYWTNPAEYSHGDEKMVDVYQRELVHILPGYVVAFDRVSLSSGFENAEVLSLFHYPYNQPTLTNGTYVCTSGPNRVFQKVLIPQAPAISWVDEEAADPDDRMETWRMEIKDSVTRPAYQFLNVFYAAKASTASMPVTARVTSRDGQMIGAVIKDPAQEHVLMFSADPTGAAPVGNIIYEVGLDTRARQHIFDLVPGLGYAIEVVRRRDRHTVTVSAGGPHAASDAGALVFTLEDVLSPSTPIARR